MRYLSIDLEATGLREYDLIIEFAAIPFDSKEKKIERDLSFHTYLTCPSFEELKRDLDPWVIEHNEALIRKASSEGLSLENFSLQLKNYLESSAVRNYFSGEKIFIFGKSLNAIDLPFLTRDLGYDFMRTYFSHKVLDLSSFALGLIDMKKLKESEHSSTALMEKFGMGEVAHTALDDAHNCAKIYLSLLDLN